MAFEQFYMLDEQYGRGFCVQEYNDRWYVQEAYKPTNGDGTIYKSWMSKYKSGKGKGFVSKDNGEPYKFPLGVEVGEATAMAIINAMGNDSAVQSGDDDDIPF